MRGRQFARDRLDLGDLLRGENGAGGPRVACPSTPPNAPERTVFATARRCPEWYPVEQRSRYRPTRQPHTARSERAAPRATAASQPGRSAQARCAPARSTRSDDGPDVPSSSKFNTGTLDPFNRSNQYFRPALLARLGSRSPCPGPAGEPVDGRTGAADRRWQVLGRDGLAELELPAVAEQGDDFLLVHAVWQ